MDCKRFTLLHSTEGNILRNQKYTNSFEEAHSIAWDTFEKSDGVTVSEASGKRTFNNCQWTDIWALMTSRPGIRYSLVLRNPSGSQKETAAPSHQPLFFQSHLHVKPVVSFLQHSGPGGWAFTQPKEGHYWPRERQPDFPVLPQASGSLLSSAKPLYVLVDESERWIWLCLQHSLLWCYCSYTSKLFSHFGTLSLPPNSPASVRPTFILRVFFFLFNC